MSTQIQRRRGTTAQHASFTGVVGETTVDTDKDTVVVHDGTTVGGHPLMRENGSNSALALGSAGTPSLKFTGDTNTGIYSPGADQVAISTGGSGRLFVDASGKVGLGTSSPSRLVTIYDSSTLTYFQLAHSGASGSSRGLEFVLNATDAAILNRENGPMYFATNNTERLRITSAGLVGVGTSSPGANLTVQSAFDAIAFRTEAGSAAPRFTVNNNSQGVIVDYYDSAGNIKNRIDARANFPSYFTAGNVGIGTSSPSSNLHIKPASGDDSAFTNGVRVERTDTPGQYGLFSYTGGAATITAVDTVGSAPTVRFFRSTNGSTTTESARIDSSGRLGIGTTPDASTQLHVYRAGGNVPLLLETNQSTAYAYFKDSGSGAYLNAVGSESNKLLFVANGSQRAQIDSSGRLLVGTSSSANAPANCKLVIRGDEDVRFEQSSGYGLRIVRQNVVPANSGLGRLDYVAYSTGTTEVVGARIQAESDGQDWASGDCPTRLLFSTTADGASSPTERMRINALGEVLIGKTANTSSVSGSVFNFVGVTGRSAHTVDSNYVFYLNRQVDDGDIIRFAQADTVEGSISVSGTTVSYNGAHLSRWSQLPSGAERTEILRGSVLSNIDEMCEWGEEANEQLNRMKVSDVEGDKNVSGVFQCWDDDDDTYTNDFYCAMTGDFIIRIAQGVTVERGDLLMSAGDGTAKPQDDDIIRSKTIAKVTSTTVSCTYDDGSYCVPCVLMAC